VSGQILSHVDEGVLRVVISHPPRFNAMDRSMWRCLSETFTELRGRGDILAVVVEGEGGHFCAGGDISEYPEFRFDEAALRSFHEGRRLGRRFRPCWIVTCRWWQRSRATAWARGWRSPAVATCAWPAHARASVRPLPGWVFPMAPREAQLVARVAGELTAREMLLSAGVLDAVEMKARGFLNQVVPAQDLIAELDRLLLAMRSPAPHGGPPEQADLAGSFRPGSRWPTWWPPPTATPTANAEHREGVMAFLEKRPAAFT
jgi:hypothetical protein